MNYYNDNDPFAAQWLRNLIEAGLIPKGYVDERSITDVDPESLRAFRQCHFFAGIGGWPYALQLAGWPEDRPVWTGSCPCQPFSVAGKGDGTSDERHLWPAFRSLISEYRPTTVFGEQVASKDGRIWLAGVRSDLEAMGYVVGAADLCAAGVSAPHARQRLYWVADAMRAKRGAQPKGRHECHRKNTGWEKETGGRVPSRKDCAVWMGIPNSAGSQSGNRPAKAARYGHTAQSADRGNLAGVVNANGYHRHWWTGPLQVGWNGIEAEIERGGRKHRAQWRIKPGIPIVAHGVSGRVGKLCGIGNAIVPQVAAEFVTAFMECKPEKKGKR